MATVASDIHWAIASLATTDSPATDVLVQGDGRAFSSRSTLRLELRRTLNPSSACARGQEQCLYCAADYHTRASRRVHFDDPDYISGDWKYLKIVTALDAPAA
jgi:hypothetical protein